MCTEECPGWLFLPGAETSVGSFFLCLLRQGVFIRGKTFLSPGTSVVRKRLLGVSVDTKCLQVTLADVFEGQLGSPSRPFSSWQFSVEIVLGDTTVLQTGDTAQQAQAPLLEYGVHGGDPCHALSSTALFTGYSVSAIITVKHILIVCWFGGS